MLFSTRHNNTLSHTSTGQTTPGGSARGNTASDNSSGSTTPPARPPPLWLLALCGAVPVVGLTLITPALPLIKEHFNATDNSVQLLLTAYLATLAIGQLVYGSVSDWLGRRVVLLFGSMLFTLAGLLTPWATSIDLLTAVRVVQGFGAAACMAMARTIINDCFERDQAAKSMSIVASMLAIAPVLSMAFGGFLADLTGWMGVMLITAASGCLIFFLSLTIISETNTQRQASIKPAVLLHAYASVLKNPLFLGFAMTSGLQVGMFFTMNGFMPFQFARHGYSAVEFGLWFSTTSLFYLVGNHINRLYLISKGIERAAMLGCILTLISIVLMWGLQLMGMTHALSLAIPCSLFGFANGIIVANTTIGAISAAGSHAGTGTGITGAWQMIAGGLGGALVVAAGGAQHFSIAMIGMVIMSCGATASMAWIYRQRHAKR